MNSFVYTNKFLLSLNQISALVLKDGNVLVYRNGVENPIVLKNDKITTKNKDILLYEYLAKAISENEEDF